MHRRHLHTLTALLGAVSTAVLPGCSRSPGVEPRIVSLTIVTGNGQSGFVGGLLVQPLTVRAADQDGVPASGVQINWGVTSGGGVVTPPETITDADGLSSSTWRLGATLGQQVVTASLPGGQPVTFVANATAAPASQIAIVSGDNQTAVVRTTLSSDLTVRVTDAFGNVKEGITVFFNVTLGNGTLSAPSAVTNATGIATAKWTLGPPAGTHRASAQIPGALPVIFDAIGLPAAAALVVVVSGNNQAAPPGALLPDSLVIRVTDQYENPVRDVTVAWTATGLAGTVSPVGGKTDAVGRLATAWTLGPTGGPKEVRAIVSGLPPAVFQAAGTIVFGSVMAGNRHTCALDAGGVGYCWGFNDAGQLGIGSVTPGSGPVFANLFPNAVTGGVTFSSGSSGASHSCAISLASVIYCWGLNNGAQLGSGPGPALPTPTLVSGSNVDYRNVSGGASHTCALTNASRLFCWGSNAEGKLGTGSASATPVAQPQAILAALTLRSVAAGGLHTCAVTTTGSLYCWGSNAQGQAGLGAAAGPNVPTLVPGTLYEQIVAGENHTCGLRQGGAVFCWGDNAFGQLGDGTTLDRNAPTAVSGGVSFASITAGQHHTCGLDQNGIAYCWGDNTLGQLGDPGNPDSTRPWPVAGGLTFRMLSAGGQQTCGVSTGSVAWCWGDNQYGALGDGTQNSSPLPVKVSFQP